MLEQHFIIYRNEHTESRNGQSEVLQTIRVEEIMTDGKRKTVYTNIRFHNDSFPPVMRTLVNKLNLQKTERRVRRFGRRAA